VSVGLMPLPLTVSCFCKIQIGFTFLVPAQPVVPDKEPLNVCVCVGLTVSTDQYTVHTRWQALSRQIPAVSEPAATTNSITQLTVDQW